MSQAQLAQLFRPNVKKHSFSLKITIWIYLLALTATIVMDGINIVGYVSNQVMLIVQMILTLIAILFLGYGIYLLYEMHDGVRMSYSDEYLVNLRYHWPLEELVCAKHHASVIFPMIIDSLNSKVKSNISFRDIKPFFVQITFLFASSVLSAFKRILGKVIIDKC